MCYIVFIPRIQRPLRPASVFSMMMMMVLKNPETTLKKLKRFISVLFYMCERLEENILIQFYFSFISILFHVVRAASGKEELIFGVV